MVNKTFDSNSAWNRIDDDLTEFNEKQYLKKYHSTEFLIRNLTTEFQGDKDFKILDLGTGGGANLYYLAKAFPFHRFTGIDINKHYIKMAKEKHQRLGIKNTEFYVIDFNESKKQNIIDNGFDIIGSSQVLNFINCEKAYQLIKQSFNKASKGVFMLSLLTDSLLDFEINITDYYFDKVVPYNIYSIPKLELMAKDCGYRIKIKKWFEIDTDLEKNQPGRGTYTIRTDKNKRLMFTDVLHLPWYFLYFERIP